MTTYVPIFTEALNYNKLKYSLHHIVIQNLRDNSGSQITEHVIKLEAIKGKAENCRKQYTKCRRINKKTRTNWAYKPIYQRINTRHITILSKQTKFRKIKKKA